MDVDAGTRTAPCSACRTDLPLDVHDAARILYHGAALRPERLADMLLTGLREHLFDGDDNALGTGAIWAWLGFQTADPEALVAAVRHYEDGGCAVARRPERDEDGGDRGAHPG